MNPPESSENSWDVVIIGGGPAGSSAATTLAQAGRKVLVLEKEKFPRFHIGESLLPYNRQVYEELGVWDKISQAGFMRKKGAQFLLGDGTRKVRLDFSKGSFTEFPEAVQVERAKFDNILLTHSQECGAEVRQECLVQELQVNAEGVVVKYRDKQGVTHQAGAKFLIDASGLSNFTANRENRRTYYAEHKKIAIFSHFAGVDMPQGEEYGDILVIRRNNSWFWMIPLEDDKVSVGLVMDRGDFQALGQEPKQVFEEAVRTTPAVQERFTKVAPPASVHVATDFSYRNNTLVSDRVIRAGDASGFIDPVFSSGVLLATTSGRQAGLVADEAIRLGQTLTPAMQAYEADTRNRIGQYWQFIERFYTQPFAQLFFQPSNRFKMMCSINAVLAGCTRLPFHVRMRLRLFFGLVWLHKKFGIAEQIPIK